VTKRLNVNFLINFYKKFWRTPSVGKQIFGGKKFETFPGQQMMFSSFFWRAYETLLFSKGPCQKQSVYISKIFTLLNGYSFYVTTIKKH
jgi:hypothetical protein